MVVRYVPRISDAEFKRLNSAIFARWTRGESVYRLMNALRTQAFLRVFDERVPDVDELSWIGDFLDPRFVLYDNFKMLNVLSQGMDSSTMLNAALAFSVSRALAKSDTPAWFELREDLAYSLFGTQLTGVRPGDVKMPFPGFYISIPAGFLTLYNEHTGEHEVRAVAVSEGYTHEKDYHPAYNCGRRLLLVMHCEPNEHSVDPEDDHIFYFSVPLFDETKSVEEMVASDEEVLIEAGLGGAGRKPLGTIMGAVYDNNSIRRLLRSFVINFLLYINAPAADIEHANEGRIRKLRKGKKTRRVKAQIERLEKEPVWVVGSRVVVSPEVKAAVREIGVRGPRKAVANVLVRGHWRRQWKGRKTPESPKGTSWYFCWIEPTVRNYDPTKKVKAHEYACKK